MQGLGLASVPAPGRRVVLEWRYISPLNPSNHVDQDARAALRGTPLEAQLQQAGRTCLAAVPPAMRRHTAFSLDGVVDAQDRVWWLEVNCNPLLHPAVYETMLDALFLREAGEG